MSRNQSHSCCGWKTTTNLHCRFSTRVSNIPNPSRDEFVSLSQRGLLLQQDEKLCLRPHLSPLQLGNQSSDMVWRPLWSSCSHRGCVGLCDASSQWWIISCLLDIFHSRTKMSSIMNLNVLELEVKQQCFYFNPKPWQCICVILMHLLSAEYRINACLSTMPGFFRNVLVIRCSYMDRN